MILNRKEVSLILNITNGIFIGLLLLCLTPIDIHAQLEEIPVQENLIESIIENLEIEGEFDYNNFYEELEFFSQNKLDLNKANEEELKQLRILNDLQISNLLSYRNNVGELISIYELQAIPSFTLDVINNILPFISVDEKQRDYQVSMKDLLSKGRSELFLKWRRVLQDQRGYDDDATTQYEGDPNRYLVRYRYAYENRFRIGFNAEKDAGESFFDGSNKNGFDFYSGHIYFREYKRWLTDLVIGDFTASMGQGLILHNDFGASKSAFVMNIKRGGRAIRPYGSINEVNFYRGVGANFKLNDNIELSTFISLNKVDGNVQTDTLGGGFEESLFSSLLLSGNHRTESEIEKERSIERFSTGGSFRYKKRNFNIGFNTLYESFNTRFERAEQLYNQFNFRGTSLYNTSLDFGYRYKNLNFFGESAIGANGSTAHIYGLLAGLNRSVDFSLLYRNYARDYQVLNSNSFGETTGTNNEKGIYLGSIITPAKGWRISAYADLFTHPWLRFRKDAPSGGKEYLLRVDYVKKRRYNLYFQYRYEEKNLNQSSEISSIDKLGLTQLHRLRLHASNKVSKEIELRSRVEFSWFDRDGSSSKGFLILQDFIYKPQSSKWRISARYSLFDTDGFDTRIYAYENDLIYEFFIPFFQRRGTRYYANLRYDVARNITAEFRYATTILDNEETIGSSLDLINGNRRTEIKAQVRFKF